MKKLIFIFALIMSILLEANAGWRVYVFKQKFTEVRLGFIDF